MYKRDKPLSLVLFKKITASPSSVDGANPTPPAGGTTTPASVGGSRTTTGDFDITVGHHRRIYEMSAVWRATKDASCTCLLEFCCPYCFHFFNSNLNLKIHISVNHAVCAFCVNNGENLTENYNIVSLMQHIKENHNVNKTQ